MGTGFRAEIRRANIRRDGKQSLISLSWIGWDFLVRLLGRQIEREYDARDGLAYNPAILLSIYHTEDKARNNYQF